MNKHLIAALEGVLFAVGDKGISKSELVDILSINNKLLNELLDELKNMYEKDESRGIKIKEFDNKFILVTKPQNHSYYTKLANKMLTAKLTQSALETLAIIAYKQPVTRSQIESIRGVNSDTMVEKLKLKNLVEEVGRATTPGKPFLYGVTSTFYDKFSIKSLSDLPKLSDISSTNSVDEDGFEKVELFNSLRDEKSTEVSKEEIINTMIELDK